ncbi:hypothetical protein [Streptomyces sp. NPDC054961]
MSGFVLLGVVVAGPMGIALARLVRARLDFRRRAKDIELAELLGSAADRLRGERERPPTREEILAAAGYVRVRKPVKFWEDAVVPGRALLKAQAAERKLMLALAFLPPGQRARYRHEWGAEMATLTSQEAAAFSVQILRSAPMMGFHLLAKEAFGSKAA